MCVLCVMQCEKLPRSSGKHKIESMLKFLEENRFIVRGFRL